MLLHKANNKMLEMAAADNHQQLFCKGTLINGGDVFANEGLTWTFTKPTLEASIAFPLLNNSTAGKQLDEMIEYYRKQQAENVGCWSLMPAHPTDLGVRLLARGFQPGWEPCWMALDFEKTTNQSTIPQGVVIQPDNHTDISLVKDLPYNQPEGYISATLLKEYPEEAQRIIAVADGTIVGQCCIFFSTGELGVAGIYNVGIIPGMRNKGIGLSIVLAACKLAKERGYRYAILNANYMGRPVYERAGFEFIGYGVTWWLIGQWYRKHPSSEKNIELAETVGRGDIAALNSLWSALSSHNLNVPLANGMTLLQLALQCNQPASAEWLINHGVAYTVLDAWDFNWKEKAAELLRNNPGEVNHLYYSYNATLMHIAAERNDIELARLALSAGVDLNILDTDYQGSSLDWAMHFNRPEIIKLIQEKIR